MKKKKIISIIAALGFAITMISILYSSFFDETYLSDINNIHDNGEMVVVTVGELSLNIEVVQSASELIRGLSGRYFLPPDAGMLFDFGRDDYHGIWMKDMLFPIDILWLDLEGKVVDLREGVEPDTYPEVFRPKSPALFVLEVNAGLARDLGINVGSEIILPARFFKKI